jgi:hypothetical protein
VSYDKISDEILKQIAEGNGRCYNHEGKVMARELIEFRTERAANGAPAPAEELSPYSLEYAQRMWPQSFANLDRMTALSRAQYVVYIHLRYARR